MSDMSYCGGFKYFLSQKPLSLLIKHALSLTSYWISSSSGMTPRHRQTSWRHNLSTGLTPGLLPVGHAQTPRLGFVLETSCSDAKTTSAGGFRCGGAVSPTWMTCLCPIQCTVAGTFVFIKIGKAKHGVINPYTGFILTFCQPNLYTGNHITDPQE